MIRAVERPVLLVHVFLPYYEKIAGALPSTCVRSRAVRCRRLLMIGGTNMRFLNLLKDYARPQIGIEQGPINNTVHNVNACSMFIDHVLISG